MADRDPQEDRGYFVTVAADRGTAAEGIEGPDPTQLPAAEREM